MIILTLYNQDSPDYMKSHFHTKNGTETIILSDGEEISTILQSKIDRHKGITKVSVEIRYDCCGKTDTG